MGKHVAGGGRKVVSARNIPTIPLSALPVMATATASMATIRRNNAAFRQNMYLDNPTRFAQLYPDDPRSVELRRRAAARTGAALHGYSDDEIER